MGWFGGASAPLASDAGKSAPKTNSVPNCSSNYPEPGQTPTMGDNIVEIRIGRSVRSQIDDLAFACRGRARTRVFRLSSEGIHEIVVVRGIVMK